MAQDAPRDEDRRAVVERLLTKDLERAAGVGSPLSERARMGARSLEDYLRAGVRPRWMQRLMEIDRGIAAETRRLERAHRAMWRECGGDRALFAARWREFAAGVRFDERLNDLIRQHNEWYPIERDLPMNPRTGEYVLINGRSYRRPELGPDWILDRFPPE